MRFSKSPLFRRASGIDKPALPHPTSNKFQAAAWEEALAALASVTDDDKNIAAAATVIGQQLFTLREYINNQLVGFSRSVAVMLLAACANREFALVMRKASKAIMKATRDRPQHIEMLADLQLYSGPTINQYSNADSITEQIVDTFPHAYFHTINLEENGITIQQAELAQRATKLVSAASLERVYRFLWQDCLWNGTAPKQAEDKIIFEPSSPTEEERWQAWVVRQQSLQMSGGFSEGLMFGEKAGKPTAERLADKTVLTFERRPNYKNGPILAPAKGWTGRQRALASKWLSLKQSYLAPFLDLPLPNAPSLTLRKLSRGWWILAELCEALMAESQSGKLATIGTIRQQAFAIKRAAVVDVVTRGLDVEPDEAEAIVSFLTVGSDDLSRLFNRGIWGNPILKAPRGENVYLISPVIILGSLIRAAEYWLEQGGASDDLLLRGKEFEDDCRRHFYNALKDNGLISDWSCPLDMLPTAKDGEEIDGLVRIGSKVLVIEFKCFLTPTEPLERYNFIERLSDGCAQVRRKAGWLQKNPAVAAKSLQCTQQDCSSFEYLPAVVTNQAYGVGWSAADVPVVDRKYLGLLLSEGTYIAETAYSREDGSYAGHENILYKTQAELERRLSKLLNDPVVMRRFKGRFDWVQQPIPSSNQTSLFSMFPILKEKEHDTEVFQRLKELLSPNQQH